MSLSDKIKILPHEPGVYRFLDKDGKIIYIGKAKDLKKRVSQYFVTPERLTSKTRVLVRNIAEIQHTVVGSEQDALLLENNLIKEYKPKYNILLKDSKSYPWICVSKEHFPRIFLTRRLVRNGSLYFGPYSSVQHARGLLDLINTLYRIRSCRLSLSPEEIERGKYRECLDFHIKRCYAPCTGKISESEYMKQIDDITEILKGNCASLIRNLKEKMEQAASELRFEQAQNYKENLELLRNHYSKSLIVSPKVTDIDVFSLVFDRYNVFGNYLRINNGCIVQTLNLQLRMNIEEDKGEVLSRFIAEIYSITSISRKNGQESAEVLVPFMPDVSLEGKNIHVPLKGDKLSLLELSLKNANAFKFSQLKQEALNSGEHAEGKEQRGNLAVEMLRQDLNMEQMPVHIECFDNSNIQGTNPVASCVVFRNGKPSKRDYRHFNIKTVVGANDFASMHEVVYRRYSRLLEEGAPLPQLILIDGGRGQLNFACKALEELRLTGKIKIIGIAKRLEELVIPDDPIPLFLDKNSPSLKLLMALRDEAHRFGITHHRAKRSKGQISSSLRRIPGVGQATEQKLLLAFKSARRVGEASIDDLTAVVGKSLAEKINNFFSRQ